LYDKALEQFYIALKLNPDDGTSYYHVGNAYLYKGLFDKAIEQYQVALKFMPDNAISHYNLGLAYLKKKENDRVLREFQTASQLNPSLKEAADYVRMLSKAHTRK
jgi:tetratricopeptide (TPR) repeat protein